MTIDPIETIQFKSNFEAASDGPERYFYTKFTEKENPIAAQEAWRIHAEGYLAMRFVNEEAITSDGFLVPEIDKARGDNVDYFILYNPLNHSDCATMRKVSLPTGGSFRDLPSYQLSKDSLTPGGFNYLENLDNPEKRLKELSALARSNQAKPSAVYELLRQAQHEAIGKEEVWFFGVVSSTYDSLARSFGRDNFVVIGQDTPIPDSRVGKQVLLRPTLLYPDTFIDTLYSSFEQATDKKHRNMLKRGFLFFTSNLDNNLLSDKLVQARYRLLNKYE